MDIAATTVGVATSAAHVASNTAYAATAIHVVNWTLIGGLLATVIPIVVGVVAVLLKIYGEKTTIADSALRESPIIIDMKADTEKKLDSITQRINENLSSITEKIREANHSKETLKGETTKALEEQRRTLDELKNMVFTMRTDLGILRTENDHQNKSIEELQNDNRELVTRLENLVKELYDYLNSTG